MDLIGIENEAEFFPAGTLSDVLKEELQDITARWAGLGKDDHPVGRLARGAGPLVEALRQLRNTSERARQAELMRDIHHELVGALGYAWKRDTAATALNEHPLIPMVSRAVDASGRDMLWILEAPAGDVGDEATDPLGACFDIDQFPLEDADAALTDRSIEEILAEGIFALPKGPRHVLVLGLSQLVLIDQRKWPARSVLRFDLQEIFTRADKDTLTVMACLISREARVPDQGVPLSDRLEEEAQRNANAVTSSLKRTVRDAIEILGQEVLDVTEGKYPSNFPEASRRGVWIDGPELSRECLRYMYRLLFLFYAEANPRLNLLDLRNPLYATGYSLEALRELESVPLRTTADRTGSFLWESLQRTLGLIYTGLDIVDDKKGSGMRLPAVKVSLLDPQSTPLLNTLRLRNEAIQKVIRLLSLRSTGKSTGRISYAKLGIGQLGAVYETLISFTGVVAKTDLIELKPRKGRSAVNETEEDADAAPEDEDEQGTEEDVAQADDAPQEDEVFRRDRVDALAASWFVPRSRIGEFDPEEVLFRGAEALVYPKGTFIYRLAGRDREKSASYYTPEPLARLLVKHALMERCKDLSADELLELKILEPAMGSAAFLVETANQLADLYLERKQKETGRTIPQEQVVIEKQKVRAYIADRNCFGIDLNPIATELGAISLWLNSLHASDFSPWFGDQLYAGNSLIGARRASYPPSFLTAKKQADLWLKAKPEEIGWRKQLPAGHVWQWLLPAQDMANFDKDKSIAPFAGEAQKQIKAWRSSGFFKKLELHEVKLLQKLSRIAEALFDQVAEDLARTRAAATDEITLWPDRLMPGSRRMDFHAKARLNARFTGADHAANTLPYRRLKTAMDAWCALWLWPLDKADQLPSRAEFLQGMAMILEGGFTADGALAAPSVSDFPPPVYELFDGPKMNASNGTTSKAPGNVQDGLFRETNVEALIENFDWLKTSVEVAERERFVHFDLIFADVMKARGGFDVIVGNPPWAKLSWNEADIIADIDPMYVVRKLTANQARAAKEQALINPKNLSKFLTSYVSAKGAQAIISSAQMQPHAGGGANNIYRCFVDLSFRLISPLGVAGLIHEDGHLAETKGGTFRKSWYARALKHFNFSNQITAKNFSEVLHTKFFSLNVYRGYEGPVQFDQFTNAFTASQVEDSYSHDGAGEIPGIKHNGKWDTRPHKSRIIIVDDGFLSLSRRHALEAEEINGHETPVLYQFLSAQLQGVFLTLMKARTFSNTEMDYQNQPLLHESGAQDAGHIVKVTGFPDRAADVVLSSPVLHVGNPLAKTPRRNCRIPQDYDPIDLNSIPEDYWPRTNYSPGRGSESLLRTSPKLDWDTTKRHVDLYRLAYRRRVDLGTERSLAGSIIPPKVFHIDAMECIAFGNEKDLLNAHALFAGLSHDFLIKSLRHGNIRGNVLRGLPWARVAETALHRGLRLACVTEPYAELWNRHAQDLDVLPWSSQDPRLRLKGPVEGPITWDRTAGLRSEFARRMALVEIDVLVAQALCLTLDQLIEIYRIYFPVLQENEAGTWYDQQGRIVWTCSKGLPGVGWLDDRGKSPGRAAWEKILAEDPSELTCIAIDDTMPGGPREVTRDFIGPFTRCDRIADYKRAWAHFERLKATEVA